MSCIWVFVHTGIGCTTFLRYYIHMQIDVFRYKVVSLWISQEYCLNNDNSMLEILDSQVWI